MFPLIFLIEDGGSNQLGNLLHAQHYAVRAFPISSNAVFEAAEHRRPHLFLIDAPLETSLELCAVIRQYKRLAQTPILVVSDKSTEDDRVRGFSLGVDDFVDKPLRPREVLARIKEDGGLKTIPTVILTTSEAEADILKSYQLRANCYLIKPVQLDEFEAVVKSINDFWLTKAKLPSRSESDDQ